ncbi:MAG: SDR family oxidoreductase [Candidatus Helarchaeota archaeon]|nr:SDR family oxidoreductase [Candidatus Helarchaeota archaeon]
MTLEGKVAIVTGGGRGIGRAIALDLAKNGADIVVAARTISEIESVAAEVRALGRQAVVIPTDMTKETDIMNLINQTHEQFGKIDILVNNAGVSGAAPVIDMKTEDWDRIINVNLRGVFIATREALKKMKPQRSGRIISISSGFGIEGQPFISAYGASKAGVILFSNALSKELHWAKVYVINPGLIDTKLAERSAGKKDPPEIIGPIASYLASDECKLKSGTVVKRLQLDNVKAAIVPLIQGHKYPTLKALLKDVEPQVTEKIKRNIEKYKKMLAFLFQEYLD